MVELLANLIDGKRVLILGYGKEGQSTYRFLKEVNSFSKLDIADINPPKNFDNSNLTVYSGEKYLDSIQLYDIVFKSPGIVLPKNYRDYNCIITSQTEIFLQAFNRQVIGVTGTKGKSTVSSLLFHVLSSKNIPCFLAGNIGTPMFDIAKDIKPETIIILELSCHQLEICNISPALSVLLNIYEDHLDHYDTFENYTNAKKNIYLHQRPLDVLYCGEMVTPEKRKNISRTIVINKDVLFFDSLESIGNIKLRGFHNLDNCAFVYSISKSFGISDEEFIDSLRSYVPLNHRLELIGNKNGVDYYDDSISTTVESTISAIESIPNASTILLGGMDRGIDYTQLVEYLIKSQIDNIILMYESGKRIYSMLSERLSDNVNPFIIYKKNLVDATEVAQEVSLPGTACILSPASASYGDFKNFEERGNIFKKILFGTGV